jgi:hypothetical protein
MLTCYNPNGLHLGGETAVPAEVLQDMKVNVRIDVSPTNPYSKFAQEQALDNLFGRKDISFEEYVKALDDDSNVPKAKLEEIIETRKALMAQMPEETPQEMPQGMPNEVPNETL